MALLLAVVCGLVAFANAGMMQQMQPMQQMQQQQQMQQGMQMVHVGNGGCNQGADGSMPEGCEIPQMNMDNMEDYLKQQMEQQQYETQAMAEKIKARFEALIRDVTAKKTRFAMSVVTEFISACECARSSTQIYNAFFLQQAQTLNLTDVVKSYDDSRLPYQATSEEEARGLIFGGLVKAMCEAAGTYLTFSDQVSQRITVLQQGKK